MRGHILDHRGHQRRARATRSLQLMVQGGDVAWAGGATRVAKDLGVAPRADVKAIVDEANAQTAVAAQPGDRHAVDRHQARPDPAHRVGDGQHGRRRDASRSTRASRRRIHELGRPARGPPVHAAVGAARQPCEITWGEVFAVLPFGNRTVDRDADRRPDDGGVPQRLPARLRPELAGGTGRFPQISGLKVTFHCNGTTPVVDGMWKTPERRRGTGDADRPDRHRPLRHQRLHVHRRRRLHRLHPGHGRAADRATLCSRSRSTTSRRTRRSRRRLKGGSRRANPG